MAYASTSDVQTRLGALFTIGASTKPSTSEVSAWLDQISALIDMHLRRAGYGTIPATGTNDALALKMVVADYAARRVIRTAFHANNLPQATLDELSETKALLDAIKNGEAVLIDQLPARNSFKVMYSKVYGSDYDPLTETD